MSGWAIINIRSCRETKGLKWKGLAGRGDLAMSCTSLIFLVRLELSQGFNWNPDFKDSLAPSSNPPQTPHPLFPNPPFLPFLPLLAYPNKTTPPPTPQHTNTHTHTPTQPHHPTQNPHPHIHHNHAHPQVRAHHLSCRLFFLLVCRHPPPATLSPYPPLLRTTPPHPPLSLSLFFEKFLFTPMSPSCGALRSWGAVKGG